MNWTDVRDALPQRGTRVLVFVDEQHRIASISSYGLPLWFDHRDRCIRPTHWAPLTIPATTHDPCPAQRGGS